MCFQLYPDIILVFIFNNTLFPILFITVHLFTMFIETPTIYFPTYVFHVIRKCAIREHNRLKMHVWLHITHIFTCDIWATFLYGWCNQRETCFLMWFLVELVFVGIVVAVPMKDSMNGGMMMMIMRVWLHLTTCSSIYQHQTALNNTRSLLSSCLHHSINQFSSSLWIVSISCVCVCLSQSPKKHNSSLLRSMISSVNIVTCCFPIC